MTCHTSAPNFVIRTNSETVRSHRNRFHQYAMFKVQAHVEPAASHIWSLISFALYVFVPVGSEFQQDDDAGQNGERRKRSFRESVQRNISARSPTLKVLRTIPAVIRSNAGSNVASWIANWILASVSSPTG